MRRIGSDIALLKALAKAVLEAGGEDRAFIERYCEGFEDFRRDVEQADWGELLAACDLSGDDVRRVARRYVDADNVVFAWGMGVTHHIHGVDNIEYLSNLGLLRGMIGKRYAGLLPLRGHSNVQGIGTIGVKPVLPAEVFARIEEHLGIRLPKGDGYDTLAGLEAAAQGGIDAALMMGGNLFAADALGIAAGDRVDITSPHGEMRGVFVYAFPMRRGDVMCYFPEANALTGRTHDPRSKTPNFKSVPVALTPA